MRVCHCGEPATHSYGTMPFCLAHARRIYVVGDVQLEALDAARMTPGVRVVHMPTGDLGTIVSVFPATEADLAEARVCWETISEPWAAERLIQCPHTAPCALDELALAPAIETTAEVA